jgi:hypothetical protein
MCSLRCDLLTKVYVAQENSADVDAAVLSHNRLDFAQEDTRRHMTARPEN